MSESLKQKLGFIVAAMMVVAALGVLNIGSTAQSATECEPDDGGGGGGTESPSPSPSESETEEPFPPSLPPILPSESESASPSPSDTEGQARRCGSEITIKHREDIERPDRNRFFGKVRSDEDACKSGRRVTVRKQRKGPDQLFDRTVTNNRGAWKVAAKGAKGRYYAETPEERVASDEGRVTCSADKSKTIRV